MCEENSLKFSPPELCRHNCAWTLYFFEKNFELQYAEIKSEIRPDLTNL